jgi:hypothetical protein
MGSICTKTTLVFNDKNREQSQHSSTDESILSLIHLFYQKLNITNLFTAYNDHDNVFTVMDRRILRLVWEIVKNDIEKVGVIMFMK